MILHRKHTYNDNHLHISPHALINRLVLENLNSNSFLKDASSKGCK